MIPDTPPGRIDDPTERLEAIVNTWNGQNNDRPDPHRHFFLPARFLLLTGDPNVFAFVTLTWPRRVPATPDLIAYHQRNGVGALAGILASYGFDAAVTEDLTEPGGTAVIEVRP